MNINIHIDMAMNIDIHIIININIESFIICYLLSITLLAIPYWLFPIGWPCVLHTNLAWPVILQTRVCERVLERLLVRMYVDIACSDNINREYSIGNR